MLLCGVTANLSSSIVSAPLAYILIVDDSRFDFFHKNSSLLLTQTKHVLEGNNQVGYYLWSGYDESGGKVNWPEMFATNYIERPEIMEDVYLYKFVQKYKIEYVGKNKNINGDENDKRMSFKRDHPGYKHAYVSKTKQRSCTNDM